ncbi:MAG: fibronectin type III domain-containing protein [Chitinispirillaceae bacterium]
MPDRKKLLAGVLFASAIAASSVWADWVTDTIPTGTNPFAIAVNPVTNRTYVANYGDGTITVIDVAANQTSTVTVGSGPRAIAVNPLTNTIYVANFTGTSVSVINGATNTVTATVSVQSYPVAIAINPATNMIYVTNYASATVTKINGSSNATSTIPVGLGPIAVCVNPVTNKIYVANSGSNSVTVINGAINDTTSIGVGTTPYAIAANTVTNKIYVANQGSNNVTVIDGGTNGTSTITAGTSPSAIAVNLVTDTIYVANSGSNNVTIIDGATGTASSVTVGTNPVAVAINATSDKVYVANYGNNSVSEIISGTFTATLRVETNPNAVAVNPITNKIYTSNTGSGNVTVIDGTTNATTAVIAGGNDLSVAVNPVTNKIYVATFISNANQQNAWVEVIDGATNHIDSVSLGTYVTNWPDFTQSNIQINPVTNKIHVTTRYVGCLLCGPSVSWDSTTNVIDGATNQLSSDGISIPTFNWASNFNPVTNKIYLTNNRSDSVTIIDKTPSSDTKLRIFFDSLPYTGFYNTTFLAQPIITGKAVNRQRPEHTGISSVLTAKTTAQASWGHATITGGAGTDSVSWTWSWGTDTLLFGGNLLCAVALDSQTTSTNNPGLGTPFTGNVTVYPIYRLTTPPVAAPVLISPLDKSIGQPLSQTFSWNSVSNATFYTLQVSIDSLFSSFIFNASVGGTTSQVVSGLAFDATYYWRVNAGNYSGVGPWSSVWRFSTIVVGAPTLSSPTNGAVSIVTTPALSWNTVTTATSYSVQVSTDSNFSTTVINQSNITATSYQATGLSINTVYYWRVDASNGAGTGPWSLRWSFTTVSTPPTTPVLSSPLNGTLNIPVNPTLSWIAAAGAASYTVQVSTDSNFSSQAVNDSNITSTSHTISSLSAYTFYYWRVKAVNAVGPGAWSLVWNFMTGSSVALSLPILISPANGSIDQPISLTLVWNKVSNATNYYFQVATDSVFSSIFKQDSTITDTMKSDSGFALGTLYYWRLRAKNAGGSSAWSNVWNFTTIATGVLPYTPSIPRAFSVSNFSHLVRYTLPKTCHVSVRYFNLKGRLIASLVNSVQGPGYYTLPLGRDLFSSGTFIQVFEAGTFVKKNLVAVVR